MVTNGCVTEWCLSETSLKLRRHLWNWVSERWGKNSIGKKLLALSYVQKRQKRSYNGYNSCAHEKGPIFDSDLFSAVVISNQVYIDGNISIHYWFFSNNVHRDLSGGSLEGCQGFVQVKLYLSILDKREFTLCSFSVMWQAVLCCLREKKRKEGTVVCLWSWLLWHKW